MTMMIKKKEIEKIENLSKLHLYTMESPSHLSLTKKVCHVKHPDLIHTGRCIWSPLESPKWNHHTILNKCQAHWRTLISVTGAEAATDDFHSFSFHSVDIHSSFKAGMIKWQGTNWIREFSGHNSSYNTL